VLWVLVAVLGLWTVPVMALPLATVGAWLAAGLAVARRPGRLLELAAATIAVGALAALLYAETFGQPGWDWAPQLPVGPLDVAEAGFAHAHLGLPVPARIVLAAAAVAGFVLHRRVGRTAVSLPLVALLVVPVLLLVLPRTPPYVRTWLYLLPVWLLAVAAGLTALATLAARRMPRRTALTAPVAAGALALGLGTVTAAGRVPYGEDPPLIGAAEFTEWLRTQPPTPIIVDVFRTPAMGYHLRRAQEDPGLIRVFHVGQEPGKPPPLLVLSGTFGDTLARSDLTGGVRAVPVRTFGDGDLRVYALPTQPPAG
jgi:hypothetical protein